VITAEQKAFTITPDRSNESFFKTVCPEAITRTRPKAKFLTNLLDLRASNRLLGLGSGRKLDSLKANLGMAKPLKSGLPNTRSSISNLHCQGPRKSLDFFGF
jgi:hypothetical protein